MPRRNILLSALIATVVLLGAGVFWFASRGSDPAVVAAPAATQVEIPTPPPAEVPAEIEVTEDAGHPGRPTAPSSQFASLLGADDMAHLPRPVINQILPAGLPQVSIEDYQGYTAVPVHGVTPGFANPTDTEPILALESHTDTVVEPLEAAWTVVGLAGAEGDGWVKVLVPAGRGALPSSNPSLVNEHAVWVPEADVTLVAADTHIEVDVAQRLLRVVTGDQVVSEFHVGVGVTGETDTPEGICSVIGHIQTQSGALGLLTNCQSERLDGFAGVDWAAFAIHQGTGFNVETGGAVSNGCIRVPNDKFAPALGQIPVGTPVFVS